MHSYSGPVLAAPVGRKRFQISAMRRASSRVSLTADSRPMCGHFTIYATAIRGFFAMSPTDAHKNHTVCG